MKDSPLKLLETMASKLPPAMLLALGCSFAAGVAGAAPEVAVRDAPSNDPGLRMAIEDLQAALGSGDRRVTLHGAGSLDPARQEYEIRSASGGWEVLSDGIGLIHGARRLAEAIRLRGFEANLTARASPVFRDRMFSYQGVRLNLPDESYYGRNKPFVNRERLRVECEAVREAMRVAAWYGFNQFTLLNLNLEDYVNYDRLGGGFEVYAPDSLHRLRSEVFCQALRELGEYARSLHLRFYLQIYEFSFPDHLDGRQLTENDELPWRMADAKFTEFFERTGIDGLVVTPTEPSPRLSYRGFQLWKTPEGAGRMAQRYHEIIVGKNRRELVLRTWMVADDRPTFERVLSTATEPTLRFETKHTNWDYFLSQSVNPLLPADAPRLRPMTVTFDVFRQFDGWGRCLMYPAFWGERFREAHRSGVVAVNAWGPWLPGCIYPGTWAGWGDPYDFMQDKASPAHAVTYLFSRLAWSPDESPERIAADWAKLRFGFQAEAATRALMLSESLWRTTYLEKDNAWSELAFKWTMLLRPGQPSVLKNAIAGVRSTFHKAYGGPKEPAPAGANSSAPGRDGGAVTLESVRASNARAVAQARAMHAEAMRVDPDRAPDAPAARAFRRAADLTLLLFETFAPYRELVFRSHGKKTPDEETRRLGRDILALLPRWKQFPDEARDWLVLDGKLATDLWGGAPQSVKDLAEKWSGTGIATRGKGDPE